MKSGKIKDNQLESMDAFEEDGYIFDSKYARLNRTVFPQGFRAVHVRERHAWIKVLR